MVQPSSTPPARERHPSQVEIDVAVQRELVKADRGSIADHELRLRKLEADHLVIARDVTDLQEHRKLGTGAKITLGVTVLGVIGSILVVIIQWGLQFATSVKADSVKQSQAKAELVVASAAPPMAEVFKQGAEEGASKALEKLHKEQEEQGLVTVPRTTLRGKSQVTRKP
jgi:hypothetical protein